MYLRLLIIAIPFLTLPAFVRLVGGVRSVVFWLILVVFVLGMSTFVPTGLPVGEICRMGHVTRDLAPHDGPGIDQVSFRIARPRRTATGGLAETLL
jgi:hypothetical protein